jgi:iron complex outermembrane receptor protein
MQTPQSVIQVGNTFLKQHFAGSLMQSLETIPGVKAMSIGSGQSKPVIRGLGFNRMIVAENGIKHEGQQWGDDHGLEIDQFALDNLEIVKGAGVLQYGSDAISGVINL